MLLNEFSALDALFQKHINEFTMLVNEFLAPTSLFLFREMLIFFRHFVVVVQKAYK